MVDSRARPCKNIRLLREDVASAGGVDPDVFRRAFRHLSKGQHDILMLRYGLKGGLLELLRDSNPIRTLEHAGEIMGIGHTSAEQQENNAAHLLAISLSEHLGNYDHSKYVTTEWALRHQSGWKG